MCIKINNFTTEDEIMAGKHGYGSVYFNKSRGCYQAAFYVNDGDRRKRKILSAPTYEDAMIQLATLRAGNMAFISENDVGASVAPVVSAVPAAPISYHKISDVWADFMKDKQTLKTNYIDWCKYMGKMLIYYLGNKNIEELTKDDINGLLQTFRYTNKGKTASAKTIEGKNKILKSFINYAINEGYIVRNPYNKNAKCPTGYKRDQREHAYTLDEVRTIMKELCYSHSMILRTIVPLLLMSGLRINELLGLQYSDLDEAKGTINIHQEVVARQRILGPVKSEASNRIIPVPPIFFDIVKNWRQYWSNSGYMDKAEPKGNTNIIFTNCRGELRNDNTIRKEFRAFLEMIELRREGTSFHGLRRTYATFMNRADVEDQVIAKLLGHDDADKNASGGLARRCYIKPDKAKMEMKKKEAVEKFMDYVGNVFQKNIVLEYI